jgi:hypothetical protein
MQSGNRRMEGTRCEGGSPVVHGAGINRNGIPHATRSPTPGSRKIAAPQRRNGKGMVRNLFRVGVCSPFAGLYAS